MTSKQIRQQFFDFFRAKEHEIVDSSPVVPFEDPTLLFANAGMNQFKDVFLGTGSRTYRRAANSQKCIRAGGKHNDLDDVGQDTYHHTFFEMLGNWSFGDYFKEEAIRWAWELLTEVWGIDKDRLHATYFEGEKAEGLEPDTEAKNLWRGVTDIDPSHVHPGDKKDNFWEMGETGPCGPCSEIHIDLTPDKNGAELVNAGDPCVIEIWNLVFIQFNRAGDGKLSPLPAKHVDTGMGLERLCAVLQQKNSNYDTDLFTPIFDAIQKRTRAPTYQGTLPGPTSASHADRSSHSDQTTVRDEQQVMVDVAYRVVADHLRCLTLALTDGALPDREGRGYVLRRILRRAVRYGRQYLNMREPFLCDLVEPLVKQMEEAFPELRSAHAGKNTEHVAEVIREEEDSFLKTLDRGIRFWNQAAMRAAYSALKPGMPIAGPLPRNGIGWIPDVRDESVFSGDPEQKFDVDGHLFSVDALRSETLQKYFVKTPMISGHDAFKLHDTYGFPIDLTQQMAEEGGFTVDVGKYERLMAQTQEKARASSKQNLDFYISGMGSAGASSKHNALEFIDTNQYSATEFCGYEHLKVNPTGVMGIVGDSTHQVELQKGDRGGLILTETPFYAEQGGQLGDRGVIQGRHSDWVFQVTDTKKVGKVYVHYGTCTNGVIQPHHPSNIQLGKPGKFSPDHLQRQEQSEAEAIVDEARRRPTMQNHTATHILNWALREVLGDHVQQKGSLVDPEKTRFDFSHPKPVTLEELTSVEELCNEQIAAQHAVYTKEVEQQKARAIETLRAVFGEKYPDVVRVVSIGAKIDDLLADPKNPQWRKYSVEFCGGTHLGNSSEATRFVLMTEEGVARGIRRVVGISGESARKAEELGRELLREMEALQQRARADAGSDAAGSDEAEEALSVRLAAFQKRIEEAVMPLRVRHALREPLTAIQKLLKERGKHEAVQAQATVRQSVEDLLAGSATVSGVTILIGEVPPASAEALRGAIDWVRSKTPASAVLLVSATDSKVTLVAGMSKDVVSRGIHAGKLIQEIVPLVGGRGGGRPDMAQGGGTEPAGVAAALDRAEDWLREKLG